MRSSVPISWKSGMRSPCLNFKYADFSRAMLVLLVFKRLEQFFQHFSDSIVIGVGKFFFVCEYLGDSGGFSLCVFSSECLECTRIGENCASNFYSDLVDSNFGQT